MLKHLFNIFLFALSYTIIYFDILKDIGKLGIGKNLIALAVFILISMLFAGIAGYLKRTKDTKDAILFKVLGNKFLLNISSLLIGLITLVLIVMGLLRTNLVYHSWVMLFTSGLAPMLIVFLLLFIVYTAVAKEKF